MVLRRPAARPPPAAAGPRFMKFMRAGSMSGLYTGRPAGGTMSHGLTGFCRNTAHLRDLRPAVVQLVRRPHHAMAKTPSDRPALRLRNHDVHLGSLIRAQPGGFCRGDRKSPPSAGFFVGARAAKLRNAALANDRQAAVPGMPIIRLMTGIARPQG